MVNGHHLGTVLGGQLLNRNPDIAHMKVLAGDLGLDKEELAKAAEKIDIVPDKNIRAAAEVLYVVVNQMAQSGYGTLEIQYLSNTLADNFIQISQVVESLTNSALDITEHQHDLEAEIQGVNHLTNEIGKIMDSIAQVARKIKMIGLNASIEAARLGEAGRGFAVVSNEIQHLSADTAKTTLQVTALNHNIEEKLQTTIENSRKTLGVTEDQSAAMEELYATVQNSVELAESIRQLFVK